MNKTELISKLLWLGYTSAEEGKEKRKEAVSMAHNLVDEYLEAINYTRCSTQLFGVSKIEIDCVTINKEYKIIFENDETYVFINDFGQADEMYKKHFKDVKTK
jgi:hypothetical protein